MAEEPETPTTETPETMTEPVVEPKVETKEPEDDTYTGEPDWEKWLASNDPEPMAPAAPQMSEEQIRASERDRILADLLKANPGQPDIIDPDQQFRVQTQKQIGELAQMMAENADLMRWNTIKANTPQATLLEKEVEAQLRTLRAQGSNVPREALFYYLLGKRVLTNASGKKGKPVSPAIPSGTAPSTARQTSPSGEKSLAELEESLRDVYI